MGKERIVERQARRKSNVADAETDSRQKPVAPRHERKAACSDAAERHEQPEEPFLDGRVVGEGAEERREDR